MGEQPQRDRKQAPLSLLKIVFPQIFGEHEQCVTCAVSKGACQATYPLSQLTKVGEQYYCYRHMLPSLHLI
jgi:hypothetical protein